MSGDAAAIINALDLKPHPEGGWYAETWRAGASGLDAGFGARRLSFSSS